MKIRLMGLLVLTMFITDEEDDTITISPLSQVQVMNFQ